MSTGRSPTVIASPALHPSVPTRTPVAACRAAHLSDPEQRQPDRCDRAALAPWHAIADDCIVVLVAVLTARDIPRD
jgi:hypothetical protein